VEKVIYPELPAHPTTSFAGSSCRKAPGRVLVRDQGRPRFREDVHRCAARVSHLANVGDAKSLVIHPATTTHYRMSDADLKLAGITAGTVRLSIGLEDPQD